MKSKQQIKQERLDFIRLALEYRRAGKHSAAHLLAKAAHKRKGMLK